MVSNGSNVRWIICSLTLAATLCMAGEHDSLLSVLKQNSFDLQHKKNSADSGQLEYSWINPISIGYDYSHSNQFDRTQVNRSLSVRVDQPIFKSGGIWYAVKYAKASRKVGDLSIEAQRRAMIKQAVASLFNIKKSQYQIKKQKLLIENDRIDIERKKEQYLSGDLDGSFLDQAILQKNRDTMTLFSLEEGLVQMRESFGNLSDMDPDKARLPRFSLVEKERFLKENIDIALGAEQITQKGYFNIMTWTRYMPTLSLQGAWIKPYKNGSIYLSGYPNATKSYYTYGFRLSMPIDITSYHTIESTRADYLRAKVTLDDKRVEAENLYDAVLKRLKVIDKKSALAKEDEALYASLVSSTKEKVAAGEMTLFDLKTMENSKAIRRIDLKIYDIERQLILLDLYEKMYDGSV
ncbi:TolC family protein [Hydrogenimonas sp.]